ncbi:hypothetical protein Clacol_005991 [Clathrus columnatus]|uniref:AB hydrolase-1 domain-containing protein n=1 Tax=Clathrus columnatus TaxID=1419009 RepID=A0AAV5AF39_9AGAM|nr:hypothetical protein Clacol_005991 [Clathrus columnatus]
MLSSRALMMNGSNGNGLHLHNGNGNGFYLDEDFEDPETYDLKGGPGYEVDIFEMQGVAREIHARGYQTLWLDQRGTGLSTPICPDVLSSKSDVDICEYVKHFRADNIVRDCEMIRWILLGDRPNPTDRKWTIMGQSFGGFCSITYLSFYPFALKEVFLAGGLAPLIYNPDPAYRRLFPRIIKRNIIYYKKYPKDIRRVGAIGFYSLVFVDDLLPNGGNLTPRRFQQLGLDFGFSGGIDRVHQIVFRAANDLKLFGQLSYKLLQSIQNATALDGNPLYMLFQETLYCNGRASNWSAERLLEDYPEFDWDIIKLKPDSEPLFFLGEMVLRHMFDDYAGLRPFKGAAEILAQKTDWPPLFNLKQLMKNEVPVSAMTFLDDMYIDFDLSQDTTERINNVEQCITNQLFHNAIIHDPKTLMSNLFELSKRLVD